MSDDHPPHRAPQTPQDAVSPRQVRAQIQAIRLVQTLQDFIFGTRNKNGILNADLSPAKVTAILGLLRKCVPDLTSTAVTADINVRYVAELRPDAHARGMGGQVWHQPPRPDG